MLLLRDKKTQNALFSAYAKQDLIIYLVLTHSFATSFEIPAGMPNLGQSIDLKIGNKIYSLEQVQS